MSDIDWRNLPALTTLRAFEATARLGGYSAAARSLNVTPAAIAQHVRKLEAEAGVTLVRREGRGLVLTEPGRQLAGPLRDAFSMIAKGFDELKLREATRGVRVSTTDMFVNAVILPELGGFWQRHPRLQVSFSPEGNTRPVDLDNFDVVVRAGPRGHRWDGCRTLPLLETPVIVCAAPGLVGTDRPDLCGLPWLQDRSIGWNVFERIIRQAGCDPDTVALVDPGSARVEMDAALLGYGLYVSPELTVRRQLSDGTLTRLFSSPDITGVYCAITRTGPLADPVRLFVDWLEAICAALADRLAGIPA